MTEDANTDTEKAATAKAESSFAPRSRNQLEFTAKALLPVAPLIANATVVSWTFGTCLRFGIPNNMIDITPGEVFASSVIGLLVATLILLVGAVLNVFLVGWLDKKRRKLFNLKAREKSKPVAFTSMTEDNFASVLALLLAVLAVLLPVYPSMA